MDHRRGSSCKSPWLPSLLSSLFSLLHSMFLPAARVYISAHSCYCVQYKSTAWFCFPCLPVVSIHLFLKKIVHVWLSSIFNLKKIDDTQTRIGLHVYARFGLIHLFLKKIICVWVSHPSSSAKDGCYYTLALDPCYACFGPIHLFSKDHPFSIKKDG